MSNKTRLKRDPFTFSLDGLTTIASFVPPPVIADDTFRRCQCVSKARNDQQCNAASVRHRADCPLAASAA